MHKGSNLLIPQPPPSPGDPGTRSCVRIPGCTFACLKFSIGPDLGTSSRGDRLKVRPCFRCLSSGGNRCGSRGLVYEVTGVRLVLGYTRHRVSTTGSLTLHGPYPGRRRRGTDGPRDPSGGSPVKTPILYRHRRHLWCPGGTWEDFISSVRISKN